MYELSRNGYDSETILKMLKGNRKIGYEFQILNVNNIPVGYVNASGTINFDSEARIKRIARLKVNDLKEIDYLNSKIKPYMCLYTSGGVLKFPLGVFLMSTPSVSSDGTITERIIECYDLTQILADDKLTERLIIPAGSNYVAMISGILAGAGITDYRIKPSSYSLSASIEFEIGTPKLDVVNALLTAINYQEIYCDATGVLVAEPYILPFKRKIEASYITNKESIVLPNATEQLDVFSAPNKVVRFLESVDRGRLIAEATNDNPESRLSTVSRGRVIVDVQSVSDIADQEALNEYTRRVLMDKTIYETVTFNSAVMPNHEFLDCLYLDNKDLKISGTYIESAWSIDLTVGGKMQHTCRKAVDL